MMHPQPGSLREPESRQRRGRRCPTAEPTKRRDCWTENIGSACGLSLFLFFMFPACASAQGVDLFTLAPDQGIQRFARLTSPTLTVRLSSDIYRIRCDARTGASKMPTNVVAFAELQKWPADTPRPTTFTWHVFLDWDFKAYPTHHPIGQRRFEAGAPFVVNLGDAVYGGRLKVIAKTVLDGQEVSGVALAQVIGENPPREAVLRAFPVNRFGQIASKIAMAESGLQQFNPQDGMPVVSRTNDVGMMQLNAPTFAITSPDQIWDWRANVRRGLEMMLEKRTTTELASRGAVDRQTAPASSALGFADAACVNLLRWYHGMSLQPPPVIPELSRKPGSGMCPGEPDPDRIALSQVERDAIRRYNGGSEYALALVSRYETLEIQKAEWQVDPTRGGVRPGAGDPDYVLHVLSARSGFAFPPPPRPKRAAPRRPRRHRSSASQSASRPRRAVR